MRIANTVNDSIVDGHGLRYAVFTQGWPHRCPGCHSPQAHDPAGGREESLEALIAGLDQNPLAAGLTLSGGEPFYQAADCARLAAMAHARGKTVWTYTGYTYEQILGKNDPDWNALLAETDVLVDGPFLEKEQSYELHFRGSRNQRLIDVAASRRAGRVILWQETDYLSKFTVPES